MGKCGASKDLLIQHTEKTLNAYNNTKKATPKTSLFTAAWVAKSALSLPQVSCRDLFSD